MMCAGNKRMDGERGVALIFTLAMLGLLMMLLLAFVGSMSVKKTVSSNAASKRQLDLLVNSAVSRLRLHLEKSEDDGKNLDETISKKSDSDDETGLPDDAADAKNSFVGLDKNNCPEGNEVLYKKDLVEGQEENVEWIYVKDPVSNSYFGRFAYAVIPNAHPVLDLKSLGKETRIGNQYNELNLADFSSGFNNGGESGVDNSNILSRDAYAAFYKNDTFDANAKEYGNFLNIFTTASGLNSEDTYLYRNPKNAGAGAEAGENYRKSVWRRFDLGSDKLVDKDGNDFEGMESNERVKALLGSGSDTEMRYFDDEGNIKNPDARNAYCLPFFQKFNNPSADESGGDYKGTFENANDLRDQIAANLIDYILDEDATVTSDKTPEAEDIEKEEHGDITIGDPPTTQNSWNLKSSTNWPDYTGNKRTLYLNEAGVVVWFEIVPQLNDQLKYTCHVMPMVELIDIYGLGKTDKELTVDNIKDDYWMGVSGEITFTIKLKNAYSLREEHTIKFPEVYTQPSVHVDGKGMYFIPKWSENVLRTHGQGSGEDSAFNKNYHLNYIYDNNDIPASDDVIIKVTKVKIDAAKLLKKNKDGEFYPVDFAKIDKEYTPEKEDSSGDDEKGVEVHLQSGTTSNATLYASAYTLDPRQNLNKDDWKSNGAKIYYDKKPDYLNGNEEKIESYQEKTDSDVDTNDEATSFGKVNPHDYNDAGANKKDYEGKLDGAGAQEIAAEFNSTPEDRPISTAYIRHGAMQSLWELGFISRGIKWQTINLKTVQANDNESDVTKFDPGYEKGDAEILDMVCLHYKDSPKFDINAKAKDISQNVVKIWQGLLAPGKSSQKLNIGNPGGSESADTANKDDLDQGDPFTLEGVADEKVKEIFTQIPDGADVEVSDEEYYFFDSDRKSFLRRSAIAPALYDAVKNKYNTDAQREALIGKVIGLADAYIYPPEVRVVVVAQLLSQQNGAATPAPIDSVRKLVIMKRTLDGRYVPSEILPL